VLILAPLAVSRQTQREGEKFGVEVTVCREDADRRSGVNIANYERLGRFDPADFGALVLDESSILKSLDGATRRALTEFGSQVPYRLACTATPAPNDYMELGAHSQFLDVMSQKEMLALFFTQDGNTTTKWRLKGHARRAFWEWIASWAVTLRMPSDIGYSDEGFLLPPLRVEQDTVDTPPGEGPTLFPIEAQGLGERQAARRLSVAERVDRVARRVNADAEPWVVWCGLNAESEALAKAIPDAIEVRGSDSPEHKEEALLGFADGRHRVIVTKPSIAGFGMNWQHCARVAFVGLSDSWEQYHQAIRRCWRFGQTRPVEVVVVTSETEGAVVRNIERKERQANEMAGELARVTGEMALGRGGRDTQAHDRDERSGSGWTVYLGDSVEVLPDVPDDSAGLVLFSPPFPGMYVYTNTPRDMGNVASMDEMIEQYRYLIPELRRVTMPGRTCAVHLTQGTAQKSRDGHVGLKDFRGRVIAAMEDEGFIYYGEVAIDKDPQVKAVRTKDRGLLFKTLANDSAHMHMALADYLLQFRKPGENPAPIRAGISEKYANPDGWITPEEWIEWAAPVWYRANSAMPGGIRETDVLNVSAARNEKDERHLAPLQLGVIQRAVKLWTNPGEKVLSPFAGVGSEGVGALRLGRRFVGVELKRSYFETACRNLEAAESQLELAMPERAA
jgi:DNA modification methylase